MKNTIKLTGIIALMITQLMATGTASAQNKNTAAAEYRAKGIVAHIVGKGKAYNDRISLRWNIDSYLLFNNLMKGGVLIDRLVIGKNNKAEAGGWKRISTDTVRALPIQAFNTPAFKSDTGKMVVAQSLYGKSDYPKGLSLFERVKLQDLEKQNKHLIVSLYSAISPGAAFAAGLAFDDKIEPDTAKKYVYRISPAKPMIGVGVIDTGFVYVLGRDKGIKDTYEGLIAKGNEGTITIKWDKKKSPFTGFYIDRSEDKVHFKRLNKNIYLPQTDTAGGVERFVYVDSVANYKKYYYRLTGLNAFGERYTYTDLATGMGVDRTAPHSPLLRFKRVKDDVTFTWNPSVDKDTKGYVLLRGKGLSANDTLASKQILGPAVTEFKLKLPANYAQAYYRILAADTSGNVSMSNPVFIFNNDTIPPAAPVGLAGNIDNKGNVTVRWNSDKHEDVLRGYKIFIGNKAELAFAPISNIVNDTTFTFTTTLKTLTKNLYVKVVAVDASYNNSKFSKPLKLNRPDTIPPPAPVLLTYANTDKGVSIHWSKDKSDDFSHYNVFRRMGGDTTWKNVLKTRIPNYTDTTVTGGAAYEYSVRTVDSTGLASPYAFPMHIQTSTIVKQAILALIGNYDNSKQLVTLKWNKPATPVKFYILYKNQGSGMSMYKSIPPTAQTFSEAGKATFANQYGLKVVYNDSTESDVYILK